MAEHPQAFPVASQDPSPILRRFGLGGRPIDRVTRGETPVRLAAGEVLIQENARVDTLDLLISGFAKASRTVREGGVQIVALFLPGDVIAASSFALGRSPVGVAALTPCTVLQVHRSSIKPRLFEGEDFARALLRITAAQSIVQQEWMVAMGRRSAYAQMAHLLCEMTVRLNGRAATVSLEHVFPLTQAELADVAGLSVVHVNRVLQQLRKEGLVEIGRGRLRVLDWEGLKEAGDFDRGYLEFGLAELRGD